MKTKKKVAFIIQHLTNGGAERTISNLSMELEDTCDVSIIIFDGENVTYPYGGRMINLKLPPVEGMLGKVVNSLKRISKVRKIKKKEHFDCVVSFMFGGNIVNVLTKQREKTVVSARNYMSAFHFGLKDKVRERFVGSRADLEIALSKMVEFDLVNNFGLPAHKVKTIYNPIDVGRIKDLAGESCDDYYFDPETYYFVTAGRFVLQKGQWHLIKAFSEFNKRIPNSRLIILSDGEMRKDLEKLSKRIGIADKIDFLGFLSNPYKYMHRASCFVLPSLFEGLGNVILEAMACAIPVISYDCLAGPRELIAPETKCSDTCNDVVWNSCGVLVPPPDKSVNWEPELEEADIKLYEAMMSVYDNPERANECVNNAMKRIQEFLPEKITAEWKAIF